ncbi:MAG TPA: hypothetical protein VM661_16985 [Candidatus Sulfotelmatobacter sp.]|nr:hypothetical protein [Candidatus Sulfotelmatobacter sp.]
MFGYFMSAESGYYIGERRSSGDKPTDPRPDDTYDPDGNGGWISNAERDAAAKAAGIQQSVERLNLQGSDASMSRGLEDLAVLLIAKGVIAKGDLPRPLLTKINNRRVIRGQEAL